jgi:murein DD-endopeptidase MepM/ murein hydrolase activator NlpD
MSVAGHIIATLLGLGLLMSPLYTFGSKRLNDLEAAHRDSSKVWARTLSESAEASLRVKRYKAAFEKRLRGVMRRQDTPSWLRLFGQDSIIDWIGNQRMLRQIARHDQVTLAEYRRDLARIAELRVQEEENLRSMRSRRDALLQWREGYVASRWKSRLLNSSVKSLSDGKKARWRAPIDGRILNLRYLGKASRPGLFFLARFGSPVQSVAPGLVLFAGEVRGFGKTVIVEHETSVGVYAHLSKFMTKRLSRLEEGGLIGLSGDLTGERVSGLYFELRRGDKVTKLRVEE